MLCLFWETSGLSLQRRNHYPVNIAVIFGIIFPFLRCLHSALPQTLSHKAQDIGSETRRNHFQNTNASSATKLRQLSRNVSRPRVDGRPWWNQKQFVPWKQWLAGRTQSLRQSEFCTKVSGGQCAREACTTWRELPTTPMSKVTQLDKTWWVRNVGARLFTCTRRIEKHAESKSGKCTLSFACWQWCLPPSQF